MNSAMQSDPTFHSNLIAKLLVQNDSMQKSIQNIATTVAESMKSLTTSFVPILEMKEKENQKLKRLLRDRSGVETDNGLLM